MTANFMRPDFRFLDIPLTDCQVSQVFLFYPYFVILRPLLDTFHDGAAFS